jgi:LysM repeat protein
MRRHFPLFLAFAIASSVGLCRAGEPARAENAAEAQELREMRQAIEQQSKQIQLLTEQIGKLTKALEGQKAPESSAAKPAEAAAAAPTTSIEAPKPAGDAAAEGPKVETTAPKAEAVVDASGASKHTVTKGETLTSIAKHYNIPIADLKNANKIENERKLQIGQILSVPTPKPTDKSDKKENP